MIKQLELELTTACNAACPQCSRNFYGGPKWPTVPDVSLSLVWLQEKLPVNFLKNLEIVRFCGTYGDPCVHPELIDIIKWIKSCSTAKISISTNGGMRSTKWWKELAATLCDSDDVIFGIDGLRDTNHIYRRNVNYNKVIENASVFINNNGRASWQFIAFEHNQHQVEEARALSRSLGFKDFILKQTTRFIDKQHKCVNHVPIIDNKKIIFLKLPSEKSLVNKGYAKYLNNAIDYKAVEVSCIAKRLEMAYIGADGYVFPCGFLADRLYGFEAEAHSDHKVMLDLFKQAGGAHMANLNYTSLDNIISGSWFNTIEASWTNELKLERCAHQCGNNNQLVSNIYSHIKGQLT